MGGVGPGGWRARAQTAASDASAEARGCPRLFPSEAACFSAPPAKSRTIPCGHSREPGGTRQQGNRLLQCRREASAAAEAGWRIGHGGRLSHGSVPRAETDESVSPADTSAPSARSPAGGFQISRQNREEMLPNQEVRQHLQCAPIPTRRD